MSSQGLRKSHIEATIDVRFGDADADTYKTEGMDNIFSQMKINEEGQAGVALPQPTETFFSVCPLG